MFATFIFATYSLTIVAIGIRVGWAMSKRKHAQTWLMREAAPMQAPEMPEPGEAWPTVQTAFYRRTNEPGSSSKME